MKKVKVVELDGCFYCVYFGMICETLDSENFTHFIEVEDEKLLNKLNELLN